jgi:phosphate/sulfate permease
MLRYTNTVEDYIAFNLFVATELPQCRQAITSARWSAGIATAAGAGVVSIRESSVFPVAAGLVLAPLLAALFGMVWKRLIRRNVAKAARQMGTHVVCEHELRLEETELVESTTLTAHRIAYRGILRVERDSEHAFIFIDRFLAHIVPVLRATEGNVEEFLSELELRRSRTGA